MHARDSIIHSVCLPVCSILTFTIWLPLHALILYSALSWSFRQDFYDKIRTTPTTFRNMCDGLTSIILVRCWWDLVWKSLLGWYTWCDWPMFNPPHPNNKLWGSLWMNIGVGSLMLIAVIIVSSPSSCCRHLVIAILLSLSSSCRPWQNYNGKMRQPQDGDDKMTTAYQSLQYLILI